MIDFTDRLIEQFATAVHSLPAEVLKNCVNIDNDTIAACAREAAKAAVAPIIWGKAIGERLSTSEVVGVLGVTRQALNKKVAQGALLGIPGRGTTYYPRWQFDEERRRIRPEVSRILGIFKRGGVSDSFTIAAWAMTPQPQVLEGMAPAEWIVKGRDVEKAVAAARCHGAPTDRNKAQRTAEPAQAEGVPAAKASPPEVKRLVSAR
jgi:hypothetical protein